MLKIFNSIATEKYNNEYLFLKIMQLDETFVLLGRTMHCKHIHNQNDIVKFLSFDDPRGISSEGLRIDKLISALNQGRSIVFVSDFPLNLISTRRQGWTREGVLTLLNALLKHFGIVQISDISVFDKHHLSEEIINQIKFHIPPIILSILPGDYCHVDDGNHRIALGEQMFGLTTLSAFIVLN